MMNGQIDGAMFTEAAKALASKEAAEIREYWAYKVLKETKCEGRVGKVALVMIVHSFAEVTEYMLRIAGLPPPEFPLLVGTAKIVPGGQVVCDKHVTRSVNLKNVLVYDNEDQLVSDFRKLADKLKLNDSDRGFMFQALQRWVSQDQRLTPSVEYAGTA